MTGPLDGLRVVELAEGLAGPMTSRLLGDAGADVIKLETPGGDRVRRWGPSDGSVGAAFRTLNRNKRSFVIPELRAEHASDLIGLAEVLVMDIGLGDADALMEANEGLIVCVISPWGPEGPWADADGGELAAQLASETVTALGRSGEEPARVGVDHASMQTASFAVLAVVAALLAREQVGGQRVDVSLFGSMLQMRSTLWVAQSNPDEWWGFHLDNYMKPPESGYTCKDRRVFLTVGRVDDFDGMIDELEMGFARSDPRWEVFREDSGGGVGRNSHVVHDLWDKGLSRWSYEEAKEIILRHGGWLFPYQNFAAFLDDPQAVAIGLFAEVTDNEGVKRKDVRPPWQFSETQVTHPTAAPKLKTLDEVSLVLKSGWARQSLEPAKEDPHDRDPV
jgi:crotonobetainyl-CoA:carnitine CoA-transferase CaiB-like acyl-CoA transferase